MTLTTYPLDEVDYLGADAALFHCTRTTGIYAGDDFSFSVTGADNIVTLQPGIAWMRISRFKGLVAAMKLETNVDVGLPDPVFPRIDRVVLQFDANKNDTEVVVKRGSASSNPNPPARSMTEAIYEIHLLEVRREPGAVAITAANITDLRLDPASCGLMADSVTSVDTSAIHNQVTALIDELRREIQGVQDGSEYLMRSGGTMTGPLHMGGNRITDLGTPTTNTDAASVGWVNKNVWAQIYKVGAIYQSADPTSPASLFGGTWEMITNRFLLAAGDLYAAGATGGEAAHALTGEEGPTHTHLLDIYTESGSASGGTLGWGSGKGGPRFGTTYAGGGQPHNNMPPYLAVYMWKRVA